MKKLSALAVAALLAIGCAEATKPAAPSPTAADPAKAMESMANPTQPVPATGAAPEAGGAAAPAEGAAAPAEAAPAATPEAPAEPEKKE